MSFFVTFVSEMIDIYDIDGVKIEYSEILKNLPITEACEHVQELMKDDYIVLSWRDSQEYTLPVGAYITFKDNNFLLLEPYEPEQKSEGEWLYEPHFQHPKMYLGKVPFIRPTKDSSSNDISLIDWSYTGGISTLLGYFCEAIESAMGLEKDSFIYTVVGEIDNIVTTSFSSVDILSALTNVANALKCEWHIDWEQKTLFFGHIMITREETEDTIYQVGDNIGIPSVRGSKEGFWNAFEPQGSTRNITRRAASGENVQANVRLALDRDTYYHLNDEDYPDGIKTPEGMIYTTSEGRVIDKLPEGQKVFAKTLIFEEIYPRLDLFAYDIRCRERYLLEDENNPNSKVIDHYDEDNKPVYKKYAVWYMRLAWPEYTDDTKTAVRAWHDYNITDVRNLNETVVRIDKNHADYVAFTMDLPFSRLCFNNRSVSYPGPDETPYFIVEVKAHDIIIKGYVTKDWSTSDTYFYSEWKGTGDDDRDEPDKDKLIAFSDAIETGDIITFISGVDKSQFPAEYSQIIDGKELYGQFAVNTRAGAETTPLAGRGNGDDGNYGFALVFHEQAETIPPYEPTGDTGVVIKRGDYEIVFQQTNDYILPTTREQGIIPKGLETPSLLGNIVNLYNIVMDSTHEQSAQIELANETLKYIKNQFTDNNSYTFKSDPVAFKKKYDEDKLSNTDSHPYIGKRVTYKNGDYELVTRVMKVVTKLDYDFIEEITVGNEVIKGSQTQLKEQVQTLISATSEGNGSSSVDEAVLKRLVQNYVAPRFLSKINDDTAQGVLRFLQSVFVGNALDVGGNAHIIGQTRIDGLLRALANIITNRIESEHYEGGWDNPFGSGFQINERSTDHISFLSVDNLFVRMKAVFTELEIRKISYAGGNIIFSHAGSRIVSVTPLYDTCDLTFDGTKAVLDGSAEFAGTELQINAGGAFDGTTLKFNDSAQKLVGYRCYLMKDDGTTATENWWRVDDQARCQTFNIDETGTYHNVSNSFYWRRVMAVGTEQLEDGTNYDYVDLSIIDAAAGSTVPQAGDTIVQMGNRTDTDRQGFISIQVAGEYAPSFEVYKGVNSYNLSGKRKICISPKYTEIRANRIIETTETGDYPLPHFRTEAWYTGMHCYYYDVVQHNGSSWLCIYPDGGIGGVPYTTEEPSENATYWRIFASEGKTGGETLTVYAWGTSDETAPSISGNAYPPAGWSTRITDRPSGGDYYLWMAETKKNPDGVIDAWGIPACISGADGTPGEDAKNIEFIYKYDPNGYNGNTGQVSPSGAASGSDTNKQQDDWVPNGWYDRALAISESNPDVYMSSRKYNASTETWGAFGTPTLWGHFGSKGIDGDGVQYVYKLFDHELTSQERKDNIPDKPDNPDEHGEWIPTGWSDDPQAPTSSMAFCYCSIIKEINGTWGLFEKLGLWSKWSEDGTSPYFADIDNEMESVACDSSGKTKAAFDQTVGVNMWHGSTPIAFTISTTSVTGITINTDATNKTIRFRVSANTSLAEVNDIAITLTASDGSGEVRTLHYVLNAVRAGGKGDPGDDAIIYSLVPSVSSVVKKKDGSYSVQNVSCTRQKNVGGTITDNTTDGTITYKIDGGSTEHSYTNNTNIPVTDFTKSIQFIFRVNSKIVDVETIPLVADGMDGSSAAVALCTPQMVSIPTDKSGKVLNDFRQEIPISLTTNNEELRLSEVTILSGGTNVELGTAVLESHADSHTTFSGTKAIMPDAQFSGTTLVVGSGSVLVPGSLIVKGAKNATITEHICEIQVKGYDHEMNEYTAKTSLSILRNVEGNNGTNGTNGSDGDDAVNVSLTPQSVILTQNEAGQMPTLTDANTTINVKLGSVDVTSLSTILSATPSKYTVSGATYNTCTCQISGKKVIITAIDQHGTETISGETINKYCEEGYIDIVVRYNGVNTTVRFNFYCNLLGTWKREVVGDAEIVAAQKVNYIYDPSNPNQVVKQSDYGEYVRSSSQNLARLNSEVEDPTTGLITKTSELKQTADGLSSDVSAIKMGKNLFKGALSADGWASEGSVPYTTPSGTVHIALPPDVGDDGWFNVVQSSHNYICRSYVSLKKNQWYVLSFYTKTTTAFNVTIYKTAASAGSWTTVKTLAIPAGSASTRRYVAFEMTGDTSDNNFFSFPVKTLRYPQLELGKDGTSTPTAFEVDSVTETSSRISQTADHIEAKVGDCGIDIDNKTITLTAEKTTVSGELTVPRVMNENADMVTICEAGVVKVQSKSTASYGVFAINSMGEVVLQMYDKDGGLVLNLGGTPNAAVNGEWVAVKFKRVDSGGSIADTRANFTATDVNCDPYYRLKLGTVMNSGTTIQYYLPNGKQTTNSTVIGRNNRVFTRIYSKEDAIATGTFITDGYYVEKNDGIFMQEMSEYFPDEAKYYVNVYHYVSGKITEITKHYF